MKRFLIYMIVLVAVWFAPVEGAYVGQLRPVQAVMVTREDDKIILTTDTGDAGQGVDGVSALENLKATTAGIIYLDTAEFLLLTQGTEDVAQQLRGELKKSVRVCNADRDIDLAAGTKYLSAHRDLPRLKSWKTGDELPLLQAIGERFLLIKNE